MDYVGRWWKAENDDGRIRCELCPRFCTVKPGQRAFCFVRKNVDGQMVLTTYGRSTGFCIDPIEKKPLNHFYPGSSVLSFGTAGCNLGCKFCQNWDMSKAREIELLSDTAAPEAIAEAAAEHGCHSVAFTYNDPVLWAEYVIDTARACRARGIKTVAVTAGYITEQAREPFFEVLDAVNIDLKAFTDSFYKRLCIGRLGPVLDTLRYVHHQTQIWLEVTTLLIPGHNDSDEEMQRLADWFIENLGPDVPLHFSAFHPDYKMLDVPRTPASTLARAREIARKTGIHYVYTGNVHDTQGGSTRCPVCDALLIERDWYQLGHWGLQNGCCAQCSTPIPGRFSAAPGTWGRRRQRVVMG